METSERRLDPTEMQRPYTFFLFKGIMGIYEAWNETEYENAIQQALRLVVFLPTDIKEALWPEKQKIGKDLNQAYSMQGVDFFTTHLVRNREARRVSAYYLEPFVDKMVRLLDEKGWLERGALRPKFMKDRKLSVTQ